MATVRIVTCECCGMPRVISRCGYCELFASLKH